MANAYPDLEQWAFAWVDAIGDLYRLNALRLQAPLASAERIDAQAALELAVQEMAARRDAALAQEACPVFWSARS